MASRSLNGMLRDWLPAAATVVFVGALALAGCTPPEPLTIGFVGSTSGRTADLGIAGRDAVQLAVERRNQSGGVAGRQVRLLLRDDEQNPEVARRVVRELIDQGAVAIIGPMTSAMAVAVVPVANQTQVLLMSPTVSTDQLTGLDDQFFRVNASTVASARRLAQFLLEQQGTHRLVAIHDIGNRSFTESWLAGFQAGFEQGGGELVGRIGFASGGDTSFLRIARNALATPVDGVVVLANATDTALLSQQIRKLDSRLPITASGWAASDRLIEVGGKAVEGLTLVQDFDRNSGATRYQEFRRLYLERFHREPEAAAVNAFDAGNVVLDALAGRRDLQQGIKEAVLAARHFEGLQEPISFDAFGDVRRKLFVTVVRDGRFTLVR